MHKFDERDRGKDNGINYKGDNSVYHRPWGVFLLGVSCWFRGGSFGFLLVNTIVSSRGFGHFLCDIIWVKVSLCSGIDCNMHSLKSKMLRLKKLIVSLIFPILKWIFTNVYWSTKQSLLLNIKYKNYYKDHQPSSTSLTWSAELTIKRL